MSSKTQLAKAHYRLCKKAKQYPKNFQQKLGCRNSPKRQGLSIWLFIGFVIVLVVVIAYLA